MPTLVRALPVVLVILAVCLAVAFCPGPQGPTPPAMPPADIHERGGWFKGHFEGQRAMANGAGLLGSSAIPCVYRDEPPRLP